MAYGQVFDDLFLGLKIHNEDFIIKVVRDTNLIEEIISLAVYSQRYGFNYNKPYTEYEVSLSSTPLFHGLSGIEKIVKVDNAFLFAAFLLKKRQKGNAAIEKNVFHGTRIENVDSICKNNLDYRLRGRYGHLGNKYGDGVSFSPELNYAKGFPRRVFGLKAMFIVKIIQTGSCQGSLGLTIPPKGCDTSISSNRSVVVKYCDNEFYPTHVAYYR